MLMFTCDVFIDPAGARLAYCRAGCSRPRLVGLIKQIALEGHRTTPRASAGARMAASGTSYNHLLVGQRQARDSPIRLSLLLDRHMAPSWVIAAILNQTIRCPRQGRCSGHFQFRLLSWTSGRHPWRWRAGLPRCRASLVGGLSLACFLSSSLVPWYLVLVYSNDEAVFMVT